MKIYEIYPTDENGILLGSAIYQSLNKHEAVTKFKEIETYSTYLEYRLVEINIKYKDIRETHKTIKVKKF